MTILINPRKSWFTNLENQAPVPKISILVNSKIMGQVEKLKFFSQDNLFGDLFLTCDLQGLWQHSAKLNPAQKCQLARDLSYSVIFGGFNMNSHHDDFSPNEPISCPPSRYFQHRFPIHIGYFQSVHCQSLHGLWIESGWDSISNYRFGFRVKTPLFGLGAKRLH